MYDRTKIYHNDKLYLIRSDSTNDVAIGQKNVGRLLDLKLKELHKINNFLGSFIRKKQFGDPTWPFKSKTIYLGADPKIYISYDVSSSNLMIGIYDDDVLTTLTLEDIKELQMYFSNCIKKITFDTLPF